MIAVKLQFTPWKPFHAVKHNDVIQRWLNDVGNNAAIGFRVGASRKWAGGKGSSPGEWPMRRSGGLIRSINYEVGANKVTVGSSAIRNVRANAPWDYSKWLKSTGRKMSEEALREAIPKTHLGRWVTWERI